MRRFSASFAPSGRGLFTPPVSDTIENVVAAANTAVRVAVPTGARIVGFSFEANVYARFGDAAVVAAVPAATTSNGAGVELNPSIRELPAAVTHISLVSSEAMRGSLVFYR